MGVVPRVYGLKLPDEFRRELGREGDIKGIALK